jgi:hypothetical protein
MTGVKLVANMSGESAKNDVTGNGSDMNGASTSVGNGTAGVTGMTRATEARP